MPAKYISNNFDPILIISQILLIFSVHYILLIFFTLLFNTFLGLRLHIDQLFSVESVDFESNYGYSFLCSNFFTHLFMIVGYIVVVDKANKILDYVLTNFFIHLILTTLNSNFPKSFIWWILNGAFISCLTLISEYIALKLDQREIKLDLKFGSDKELKELKK
jgi:hypothetical protein